jgi:phosphoribosylaminoimidazole carboxylase PurE protein
MGSDSDLRYMIPAVDVLNDFGVPNETRFVSAHRTPDWMHEYAADAEQRGLLAIIAGAGGSAHLQGMSASETILPVVGVAVEPNPDPMNAAFASEVRMPADGGPLATMGKNEAGATNAGLHVVRFLSHVFPELKQMIRDRMETKAAEVLAKDARVVEIGPHAYLQEQKAKSKA